MSAEIETNLYLQIAELQEALFTCRKYCASNLNNPGNENDTLQAVIDTVTGVLQDGYEFKYFEEDCTHCEGTGYIEGEFRNGCEGVEDCPYCAGEGRV